MVWILIRLELIRLLRYIQRSRNVSAIKFRTINCLGMNQVEMSFWGVSGFALLIIDQLHLLLIFRIYN